jgi:histidinol-phosphate aminotransferase
MIGSLTDGVYINSNENPLGPCPAALRALSGLERLGGRYGMAFADRLAGLFARQNGLAPENVVVHPGSYAPLCAAGLAFSSKERPVAYAEPTFDSGFMGANGKPVTRAVTIALGGNFQLDVRKLLAAAPDAGLYYICNPNNPTGLVTPRADIEWLLANKPAGSVVLVDEAYIHYSDAQSCLDLVATGQDILVLRTFSKIYGMAGARLGLAIGHPALLERLAVFGGDNVPAGSALFGGLASLEDVKLLPQRKALNAQLRDETITWLKGRGFTCTASQSNCFMIDVKQPAQQVIDKLAAQGVLIGRVWQNWPQWVRVTVGNKREMARFREVFAAQV